MGRLIIAGTVRLGAGHLEKARPHMARMIEASRAEDGCLVYSYAVDVADPTCVRVFEIWRDAEAFEAHTRSDHIKAWRAVWSEIGLSDRDLTRYEIASSQPI